MHTPTPDNVNARGMRIGLAVSRYHRDITESMRDAAIEAFVKAGGNAAEGLVIVPASGSFELTAICRSLAMLELSNGRPALDAIVAIGCLITGQTTHDQHIAQSVTQGLTAITVRTGTPIAFAVLTCQTLEQARARSIDAGAAGHGNKGAEAMVAAIETATTMKSLAHWKDPR